MSFATMPIKAFLVFLSHLSELPRNAGSCVRRFLQVSVEAVAGRGCLVLLRKKTLCNSVPLGKQVLLVVAEGFFAMADAVIFPSVISYLPAGMILHL